MFGQIVNTIRQRISSRSPDQTGQIQEAPKKSTVYQKPVPKTDEEFVAYVNKKIEDQRLTRYTLEKNWFLQVAYFMGLHYFSWSDRDRSLREPQVPTYRVRLVVNYILSTVETALAKLLKNRPILNVTPSSDDEQDASAAKFGGQLLESTWQRLDLPRLLHYLGKWFLVTGTAWLHVYWDGKAGDSWQEQGADVGPDGQPHPETFYLGDVAVEVVPPFEILVDPAAKHTSEAQWLLRRKSMAVEDARSRFPQQADKIVPNKELQRSTQFDSRLLMLGVGSAEYQQPKGLENMVVVNELWERPSALSDEERQEFPKGRVVTTCGQSFIQKIPFPYDHAEIPYVQFEAITVPGRLWGIGFSELIMVLNRAYNRGRSRILEGLALMGAPKWLMTSNSMAGVESIDSEPGEILRYNQGEDHPTMVSPPSLIAPGHMESMQRDLVDIQEVSGLREVSRGSAPTGVTSGVAINLMQEQDDTRYSLVVTRFEMGMERTGRLLLQTMRQFYTEPRLVKITGDDGNIDAVEFTGSDLRDNVDVRVVVGSGMPQSKIARQALIFDMWDKRLLPQDNLPLVWNLLDMPGISKLYKEELVDIRCADEENRRMRRGQPAQIFMFQDHGQHIARHNIFRKSSNYQRLDPYIQQFIDGHVAQHEQFQQQAQPQIGPAQAGNANPGFNPNGVPPGAEGMAPGTTPVPTIA